MNVKDRFGRPIRDLRVSVTDKCNFRCTYCMPKEVFGDHYAFLPENQLLSFDEIVKLIRVFAYMGVEKVRITGGEPLLRKNVSELIGKIAKIEQIKDIGLTTNGVLLKRHAKDLFAAGLRRLNISLDALDSMICRQMSGRNTSPKIILETINYVQKLGFNIKINMVVKKGINETEILPMIQYFKARNITLRFIEFMDVGNDNKWSMDQVFTKKEIIDIVQQHYDVIPVDKEYYGEVAKRYKFVDHDAQIGFISSVTESFCSTCTRARISSDGKLFTCLFSSEGIDLRTLLRQGISNEDLVKVISAVWENRDDRYSDERTIKNIKTQKKINMNYIGG